MAEVRRGDVWLLGDHRLMCGDSTDHDDVARLMGGGYAELLFTSPPYDDLREYNGGKDLYVSHLATFIPTYAPYCEYQAVNLGFKRKGGEIVPYWDEYIDAAHGAGLKLMAWNVWDKGECGTVAAQNAFVPIRHEFIFVFGTKDKPLNKTWRKRDKPRPNAITKIRTPDGTWRSTTKTNKTDKFKQMESVLQCKLDKSRNAMGHPAAFPARLPGEYIAAITSEGDIIAEPFAGSGTTIIAAERYGRRCYAMELDPGYIEVAIWRWEGVTGRRAVKE